MSAENRASRRAAATPAKGGAARPGPPAAARARNPKGEETRARILETSLALFRERGYEETTIADIAEEAGVSLGNAYYYFESKEHLIQAFYGRTHAEHAALSAPILAERGTLEVRLRRVMHAKIDSIEPYHRFSGLLFRSASDPESPLNPFSAESEPVRDQATALFAELVDGSTNRIPADVRAELPRLLWIYHMGVVLYWIHDRSPDRAKTRRLIDLSVELIAKLVAIASNPLMLPLRKAALRMIGETKG